MLTKWTIGNFKSIREPVTLDFSPLTIFAGANSSGKSTVIQSLLMLAQSLSPDSEGDQLILNGKYVKLGNITDVLHWGNDKELLQIGFELQGPDELLLPIRLESSIGYHTPLRSVARTNNKSVPWVKETTVEFYDHELYQTRNRKQQRILQIRALKNADLGRLREYVTLSPEIRERIKNGIYDYDVVEPASQGLVKDTTLERVKRAGVPNLLPNRMLVERNLQLNQLYEDMQWIIDTLTRMSRPDQLSAEKPRPVYMSFLIRDVFESFQVPAPEESDRRSNYDMRPFHNWIIKEAKNLSQQSVVNKLLSERYAYRAMAEYSRYLEVALSRYRRQRPPFAESSEIGSLEVRLLPQDITWALDQIRRVFGQGVYYLGPLRADPSVLYAAPGNIGEVNIGLKGEYTAAMLDEYRNMEIEFPYPVASTDKFVGKFELGHAPLIKALQIWLERMGMLESVDTEETPKVGYRLSVYSPGLAKKLDLTSVGVGVSQVLPTLVLALLAPSNSILVFEQPELHLHPKVHSVLGDFFLGIAACGKQCVVETHSEHIITRIRRRITESPTRDILDQTKIYFVEKEGSVSRFRAVEPNEYGSIPDWPKGFFDEAQLESSAILRSQIEKRKAEDRPARRS